MLASMPKQSGSLVDNANHVKVSSPPSLPLTLPTQYYCAANLLVIRN